jgi:Carboxypeptidase regulatory-like domain
MWLSLPAETLTVRGRLVSALIEPQTGFLARAFRGSQLISNIADTQYAGVFSLTIPTANLASDPTHTITVELTPKDDKAADPRFTSHNITLGMNADLGDLHLPTFGDPNVFRFDVRGDGTAATSISGAVVRVRASIAGSPDGMAEYARAGLTDAQGIADLSLLPGTIETLRPYDITVIPPSDSPFGVLCVPLFPLATGGTPTAPVLARKIALPRRPALTGRLTSSDGNAVASMNIVATRIDSRPTNLGACGSAVVSGSAMVTTDKDGNYTLPLDPGTYRLDYDPPVGTAVPRLTESTITVSADQQRDITLQPARLIEGTVTGTNGEPVTAVGVHLFKVRCRPMQPCNAADGSTDPLLWAVGRTDIHGTFRLVIPQDGGD